MFLMRFDMRAPEFGASTTELYSTAIEMAEYAESRGAIAAAVCEHHTQPDGYLPSPMTLATAMAARTSTLAITTAAVILPLYDPVRLAEDMVVLDIISGGRVAYIVAIGYRPEEFEHLGRDFGRRGKLVEEQLEVLLRAKTGEPFEHDGRRIHVTPAPVTPGGPMVMWGGGSPVAAKRAGRFGLSFMAQGGGAELEQVYLDACAEAGNEPGMCMIPDVDSSTSTFVAHDVDEAWSELGPHLLHDAQAYAAINPGNAHTASLSFASTVDELRAENRSHRILSVDEAVETIRSGVPLAMQPLSGGLHPELAWKYLKVVTDDVMPLVAG